MIKWIKGMVEEYYCTDCALHFEPEEDGRCYCQDCKAPASLGGCTHYKEEGVQRALEGLKGLIWRKLWD